VTARYVGVRRGCGAYTQPRNGKGDPTRTANAAIPELSSGDGRPSGCSRRWRKWLDRSGRLPSSYDW
jgi:hypothetical protein